MILKKELISSGYDGLSLEIEMICPGKAPKAVVQFSHGMTEHKERYEDFMGFLSENGYACVIHDHRGHGKSVRDEADLGFFYTEDASAISDDLYMVTKYIKDKFPGLPIYMFSHSMGTLVARSYIKAHDTELSGLVLCGPPTRNPAAGLGLFLARLSALIHGGRYKSRYIDRLTFSLFNKGHEQKNGWLSSDPASVELYNQDPLCGFTFTNNGFINLFSLMIEAYKREGYEVKNPRLPIFLMAGAEDPVIQSRDRFYELSEFLKKLGYSDVRSKLYEGMRHELLNERERKQVYRDVLSFLQNIT